MKTHTFEVTLDLLEEMSDCIHNCSWVSGDEIYAYMKGCITGTEYEPENGVLTAKVR